MFVVRKSPKALLILSLLATSAAGSVAAQAQNQPELQPQGEVLTTVFSPEIPPLAEMTAGPEIEGTISARSGDRMQVTDANGAKSVVTITDETAVKASGGFLGLNRNNLAATSLLNGLPVKVETMQWDGGLVASRIDLKNRDLRFASMIRDGTEQRFNEHGEAIQQNAAATEALRGRFGDIDQYNVKSTVNVNFDVAKSALSPQAESDLCATAAEAGSIDNALLLVVGYADSTGDQEFNQELSEKRASRVVNHLQQACGWKPYRMLTPTGMAEADPVASNDTPEGRAQNRRVAVNVLVSKAIEGL